MILKIRKYLRIYKIKHEMAESINFFYDNIILSIIYQKEPEHKMALYYAL